MYVKTLHYKIKTSETNGVLDSDEKISSFAASSYSDYTPHADYERKQDILTDIRNVSNGVTAGCVSVDFMELTKIRRLNA